MIYDPLGMSPDLISSMGRVHSNFLFRGLASLTAGVSIHSQRWAKLCLNNFTKA